MMAVQSIKFSDVLFFHSLIFTDDSRPVKFIFNPGSVTQ